MASIEVILLNLLLITGVAIIARTIAASSQKVPYPVVLILAGLLVSILQLDFTFGLSHDLIFFVVLPPVLFTGALRLNIEGFRNHLPLVAILLIVALPASVALMGVVWHYLFEFPLLISLLLASMLYPLDPAAILSVFKQMDAPERLLSIIEGEPLFDDGFAVVIFSTFLAVMETRSVGESAQVEASQILNFSVLSDLVVVSGGGLLVGGALSAIVFIAGARFFEDKLTELLLSVFVAYGSILVAEHFLHVSGILAVVAAGLVVRIAEEDESLPDETTEFIQSVWEVLEFLVNTLVYLLIGALVDISSLIEHWQLILFGVGLFLVVRALMVYTLTPVANRFLAEPVPLNHQHVLVWGALHTVVPIAMVLSLPPETPSRSVLHTVVFGVAVVSILVQGLSISSLLRVTDVV